MRSWNSFVSMTPLPSVSASVKASRRKLMKSRCFRSCSRASLSLRSEVAAIIVSEATAVSNEIMVQEANTMKKMKKSRQACTNPILLSRAIMDSAISYQLSVVVSWNREKKEVSTLWKRSRTISHGSFSGRPTRASPCPNTCVRMIAMLRMETSSTKKTQTKVLNMTPRACKNASSFVNISKMRRTRIKRSSLIQRSTSMFCSPGSRKGATQRSRTPSMMMIVLNTAHIRLVLNHLKPLLIKCKKNSQMRITMKMLSTSHHLGQSGKSVSPATAMALDTVTVPMTTWNLGSSRKSSLGQLLFSSSFFLSSKRENGRSPASSAASTSASSPSTSSSSSSCSSPLPLASLPPDSLRSSLF
mmetsp:Transcript_21018/g.56043  ORF Transcript_21018/g.56043 Transcript_21018/m.56043 type:complete len:358 (+) Transcript_21018:521-1594(+)